MFVEWRAMRSLDPFGDERADWRIAKLAALIANVNRDPKSRAMPFKAEDFLVRFEPPQVRRRTQTADQTFDNFLLAAGASPKVLAQIEEARKRRKKKSKT